MVFLTNLDPHEIADEAFLRRLPNKIPIADVDAEAFDAILRLSAAAAGMECEPGVAEYLRELCLRRSSGLLPVTRAYLDGHPRHRTLRGEASHA